MSETPSVNLENIVVSYPSKRRRAQTQTVKSLIRSSAHSLLKRERRRQERVYALRGVSLRLRSGDVAGIIGENGAGKTTLLRVASKLLQPDSGQVDVKGSVSTVFNLGAGFLPDLTGRENIHLMGAVHGIKSRRLQGLEEDIIEFSGIGGAVDRPLKTFSAGMKARLGFSVVAFLNTDIIILDEVLSAGDVRFRRKAGNLIDRFAHEQKILIVVSHSNAAIREHCNIAFCLRKGQVVAEGDPKEVCDFYLSKSKYRQAEENKNR